jgi:hypothetical protein
VYRAGPASESYADVRAWVLEVDPDLAQAEEDVDLTLLETTGRLSPFQRLENATAMAEELLRLRELPRR